MVYLINRPFLFNFAHFFHPISPESGPFEGEFVPVRKKFPQHVSQKLLILLILLRFAVAVIPL